MGSSKSSLIVWIVEDEAPYRETLATALRHGSGIRCEQAFPSCEETLKHIEGGGIADVILMDIVLGGMDGIEGARRIKELAPSVDIMILTNYDDDDKVFRAICAGAAGYLLKTLSAKEIRASIREIADGGAPMNPQIARKGGCFKVS